MVAKLNIQEAVYQRITRNMRALFAMLVIAGLAKRIGSHPAANMLDILLFMKADIRENLVFINLGRAWLFLNLIIVIASWVVIFTGIMRSLSSIA